MIPTYKKTFATYPAKDAEPFCEIVRKQQEDIKKRFAVLATLYPGAFDKYNKPLVATTPPLYE